MITAARRSRVVAGVGIVILLGVLLRTAWVCDDAYITFRTADNIVHGYGPVWNTGERVQGFTHPLWLGVFTAVYAITREPYYTSIALGMVLSIGMAVLLARFVALTPWSLMACLAALASSKAFVDYSTSGLDNALSHALLVTFVWRWWADAPGRVRLRRLSLIAALCMLNRIDLGLLVGPALMVEAWRLGPRTSVGPLLAGLSPLIAWEAFSAVYYASLVPNTAYAKLNIATPLPVLFVRGLNYMRRTLVSDPVTLPAMALAALAILKTERRSWPLLVGLALSLLYLCRIGGDFMMGRFLTAPFVWSVALLARAPWLRTRRAGASAAAVCVVLGLAAPWEPALLSGYGYARLDNLLHGLSTVTPRDNAANINLYGVMDERRYYYESTGLLKSRPGNPRPDHPMAVDGRQLRAGSARVVTRDGIGFTGYFAGPNVHIVDIYALTDPLLARLPAIPNSRTGHYLRDIPAGYLESLESNTNRIADPDLAVYYDRLRLAVSGPLWDRERLATVAGLLTGRYDRYLTAFLRPTTGDAASLP